MASVSPVTPVTIFQAARDRVSEEIGSIVECLNNKRTELFEEIASLEREFSDKQKEKQKDITKLNTLISQTEELGQNTLLKVQERVKQDLQLEIGKIKQETFAPEFTVTVKWGFNRSTLINHINNSKTSKVLVTTANKTESNIDEVSSSPLQDVFWDQNTAGLQNELSPGENTHIQLYSVSCEEKSSVSSSMEGSPVINVHLLPDDMNTETLEYALVDETDSNNEYKKDLRKQIEGPKREYSTHKENIRGQSRRYFDHAPRGSHREHNMHPRGHRREPNLHPRGHRREYSHPRGGSRRESEHQYNKYREY